MCILIETNVLIIYSVRVGVCMALLC